MPTTLDELIAALLQILPESTVGEDNEGQIVVYTNLYENAQGKLQPFDSADELLALLDD